MKQKTESDRPRMCRYCENASELRSEDEVLCKLHGIVDGGYRCRKFMYDPLKRRPRMLPDIPKLDIE